MRVELQRYVAPLLVGTLIASSAYAATYEYTNPDGTAGYSDNPYEAGVDGPHSPPETIIDLRGEPVVEAETPTESPATPEKPKGVSLVGSPDYGYTPEGLTTITLTLKNELDNPVTDIVVAITLLDGAKEPLDTVSLRGPTGIDGRTEPGGTVVITGVANTPPDLIDDQEVTTSWANLTKNAPPAPPVVATPEPTPTPTPPLTKEDLPVSRTQQKRLLKQKLLEQEKEQGKTP